MRLKERVIDPRALIWVSVGCFVVGYIAWEVLDPPMGQEDRRSQSLSLRSFDHDVSLKYLQEPKR
jgi:hypothetical protein